MNESLFRKKSLDKINSPEDLDHYLRVTNPPIYLAMAAVVLLLLGALVWSVTGHIESTVGGKVSLRDGEWVVTVSRGDVFRIPDQVGVRVDGQEWTAERTDDEDPLCEYARLVGDVALDGDEYDAQVVLESIAPWSFLLNSGN